MTDPNMSPAWQAPLKDLHLARVMFRELRANIITWQKDEYDEQTLAFLNPGPAEGKPFPHDFSGDPDDIKQIKNVTNALYLAEQAFDKCGNLNIIKPSTYDLKLISEAYEACHLLLDLTANIEDNFRHEIIYFASGLASLLNLANPNTPHATFNSHDVGLTVGRAIEHRKPTSGQSGYDLLTYCGAVFPAYPSYIETLRVTIEKQTSKNPEHAPNINKQKMEQLVAQGKNLSRTIANSNQNSLFFVFNLISLIRQTHTLWGEIYQEAGELNDSLQSLGREYLALLKYELLPTLFRGVDKLEMQLMLKPGRLSKPLMEKIKPWHEALVQRAKSWITFNKTNEQLLKLEDTRFIELRLKPIQQNIETSKTVLHLVEPALAALQACLQADSKKDAFIRLEQYVTALTPYMLSTDKTLLSRIEKHLLPEATWKDYLLDWYHYATFSNEKKTNKPTNEPLDENIKQTIRELQQHWEQLKKNHTFKLDRYNGQAKSIQEKAHRVLFPYPKNMHAFQVSEQEALENAYLSSENLPADKKIGYQKEGHDTYVQYPKKLSTNASWALYRSYEQKIKQLKQAQTDCGHLLDALKDEHTPWNDAKALNFTPESKYTPVLLDHDVLRQPGKIYLNIEDGVLKYEVLEPADKPTLYLMTVEEAIGADHKGYVWDHDHNQLSYIAKDGNVQSKIKLSSTMYLRIFIETQKSKLGKNKDLQLNEDILKNTITSRGHHPGVIQKGSIPLAELGCSLTALKSTEQLKPYLPHIFNEAFERGHIQDGFKTNCIRWYSSIQPYLTDLKFDERITRLFSGSFATNTANTKNAPNISLTEANTQWLALQLKLSNQITKLEQKRHAHAEQVENKTFIINPKPDNKLKHREFSLDTAQFMSSVDPIKRQIHNSKKTCFKIKLALDHLEAYDLNACLNKEDYPWFQQTYVGQLSHATASQIKAQLDQIKAYETLQIKRNEQLLTQLKPPSSPQPNATHNEKDAFMYFGHTYEPVVMQDGAKTKPGELQLNVENGELSYTFMHYGKELHGDIALHLIKPALTAFDKNTVIKKDTLTNILNIIYMQREHQIDLNPDELSPDEALDLYQWYLNQPEPDSEKIIKYRLHAEKKPDFIDNSQKNNTPKDRSDYLIKHTRISQYLSNLKSAVHKHFGNLNTSLNQELCLAKDKIDLPYPEVGAQNWLTNVLKELVERKPIAFVGALPWFDKQPEAVHLTTLENPQQVLLLKRLMNVIYYLEHIVLEMEKINEKDGQIPYVMHLVISFFYYQDIAPLLSELAKDPVFSATHADIIHKVEVISNLLTHESKYYLEANNPEDKEKNKQATLHSILNTLKMLPVRLSSSTADFEEKRPGLKQATEKSVRNIETILEHYNSSWSYVLLILDLPIIQHLLSDMRHDFEGLLEQSHAATLNNLSKLKTEYLAKIALEADKIENSLGLKPGLISIPLNEILNEFYKGLITPLTPEVDQQIKLLCDNTPLTERLTAAKSRKKSAETNLAHYKRSSQTIQTLLDTCADTKEVLDSITGSAMEDFFLEDEALSRLNTAYQETLPTLKASLNSSDMHLLSIQAAKQKELRDCFVFDEKKSQLYHLDAEGKLNPQTGRKLFLKSIPANEKIPDNLKHETTRLFPFDSIKRDVDGNTYKVSPETANIPDLELKTEYPTLVKHGDKYYLYEPVITDDCIGLASIKSVYEQGNQAYTELNAEIIADMKLDFSRKKPLDIHKKHQGMYDEIAAKTGLIYPIHLKNTFKTLRFITKKKESCGNAEKLYLSEHAISEYISSNSDFSLQKHGVSIKPGCCLISLDTVPTNFYELKLPAGYGSYYAQIANSTEVLYYIDTETSSIQKLSIPDNKKGTSEIKVLQDTRKEKIFDAHDFENITALTGHTCAASVMIDVNNFEPDVESFEKLHALTKRSNAYYKGMINTSKLAEATADEQLVFLNKSHSQQEEKHNGIKRAIYTDYFDSNAHELAHNLARKKVDLQGYKLRLLTDETTLTPGFIYIKIRDGALDYRVINPAGKHRKSTIKLSQISWPQNMPLNSDSDTINALTPYLPEILKITSKKGDGHTHRHSLIHDYKKKLTQALCSTKDNAVERAVMSGSSKVIDKTLAREKAAFNKKHLEHYKQLDAINKAVGDFRLYLERTKKAQSKKELSFFENADTLNKKREILAHINSTSSDASREPKDRVEAIQEYLRAFETSDTLMAYHAHTSTSLASLLQCMFRLLEAAGLYTPEMTQRLDKLVDAVKQEEKNPPQVNNPWSFFSKTTKEKIKEKMLTPKPSDTTPEI
jgi:hypothetical protein